MRRHPVARLVPVHMRVAGALLASTLLACTLGSCAHQTTEPAGALVGRFGGMAAEISLSSSVVDVRLGCGLYRGVGPVTPDAEGRFVLALVPRPGNPMRSATLRGTTDRATIDAEMTIVHAEGEATSSFIVRKGVAPDYSILSCIVPTG